MDQPDEELRPRRDPSAFEGPTVDRPTVDHERTVIDKSMAVSLVREALLEEPVLGGDRVEASPARSRPARRPTSTPKPADGVRGRIDPADTLREPGIPRRGPWEAEAEALAASPGDLEDQLTLRPGDMRSSVAPRPVITSPTSGPAAASIEARALPDPKALRNGLEAKPAKITVSDPKQARGNAEVRVTPAGGVGGSSAAASPAPSRAERFRRSEVDPAKETDQEIVAPKLPERVLRDLGPIEKMRESEMTVLDLAAQVGLAPEPIASPGLPGGGPSIVLPPADARSTPNTSPRSAEAAGLMMPLPEASKVAELLEDDAAEAASRALNAPIRRNATISRHLPRWLGLTTSAAKVIPVILAVFVALATLSIVITLFSGRGGGGTEHVTLRFLPVNGVDGNPAANPNLTSPMFTLETEPEGILVVLDRKILGPTPLTFELPMKADRVGVELTSPYFEIWIGETVREPTGEMHTKAKLKRRR